MSQKFCDVFPTVTLPEQYGTLADMITVDRIVSTRQKDMLKVYITCERLIEKQDIFETFFSYLPQDLDILCEQNPENPQYKEWKTWMDLHYETLKQSVCQKNAKISMGLLIVSCTRR